jgi:hypothetical protein
MIAGEDRVLREGDAAPVPAETPHRGGTPAWGDALDVRVVETPAAAFRPAGWSLVWPCSRWLRTS